MRRVTLVLLALLAVAAGPVSGAEADAELDTRVFEIHHKNMEEVVSLIEGALSDDSSVLMRRRIRTLAVTDRPTNLEEVARLIKAFDVPPQNVSVRISLVRASRGMPGVAAKRSPPGVLPQSFRELTKFVDYELLGGMALETTESESSSLMLGDEYRIRFEVDQVDDRAGRVRLRDFVLERREIRPEEGEVWVPIMDTVVSLRSGTPYLFGATRGQEARRALFVSITAAIGD